MRAVLFDEFGSVPEVTDVADPEPPAGGVVVRVEATGLCRSDWHALTGHDPDVVLPHVPGHEFAGVVEALGSGVDPGWLGVRVTAPFVQACGVCEPCLRGQHQVCLDQVQAGFTRWGSFAERVVVERAAVNLVRVPEGVDLAVAAVLGCRFGTAYRAVTAVGDVRPGEWVAVHGCGGVGLSAVMIAVAAGARVVAVDISDAALELARSFGAEVTVRGQAPGRANAGVNGPANDHGNGPITDSVRTVREVTGGGAHVCLDALGSPETCATSIASLRVSGRHVQVGLLPAALGPTAVPMDLVVARELRVLGSHGLAGHEYPALLALVETGRLRPDRLITTRLALDEAGPALDAMGRGPGPVGAQSKSGIAVVYPAESSGDNTPPGL